LRGLCRYERAAQQGQVASRVVLWEVVICWQESNVRVKKAVFFGNESFVDEEEEKVPLRRSGALPIYEAIEAPKKYSKRLARENGSVIHHHF
jgi:hypothetical protein